jgi:hypothetical protein
VIPARIRDRPVFDSRWDQFLFVDFFQLFLFFRPATLLNTAAYIYIYVHAHIACLILACVQLRDIFCIFSFICVVGDAYGGGRWLERHDGGSGGDEDDDEDGKSKKV